MSPLYHIEVPRGFSYGQSQVTLEVHCNTNKIVTLASQSKEGFGIPQGPRVMQHGSIMWTINLIV